METAIAKPARLSLSERFNFRILLFVAFLIVVVGYPVYVYLEGVFTGGVKRLGDGVTQVDLKFMSTFMFDQVNGTIDDVPQRWRDLHGTTVVLEGEMWSPSYAGYEVPAFQLCYSVAQCCFSGPPQVQHFVNTTAKGGGMIPFFDGKVRVVGTLKVEVKRDEAANKVASVFELELEDIRPVG
ncbi:MAG TPA: hypothetical protein PLD59_01020 [Tepidisphaeraceae bacterium]|nr:hypothetical protein [Tepidisphaeraceae bacterium]